MVPTATLDPDKLNAFLGRFVADLGASVHAGMVVIGERLGLYKALARRAMTSAQLAAETETDERYVREWLASQAAGGYVSYHHESDLFSLSEEQVPRTMLPAGTRKVQRDGGGFFRPKQRIGAQGGTRVDRHVRQIQLGK